jgi:hypothetical protein
MPNDPPYLDYSEQDDCLSGGVRTIAVSTPSATFKVGTKRVGNNPATKQLLLHGVVHRRFAGTTGRLGDAAEVDQRFLPDVAAKEIRTLRPDQGVWSFTSQQQTLRRLYRAFGAFFRAVKAGETPGYPRFRAASRFDSLDFRHSDGIKFLPPRNDARSKALAMFRFVCTGNSRRTPPSGMCP